MQKKYTVMPGFVSDSLPGFNQQVGRIRRTPPLDIDLSIPIPNGVNRLIDLDGNSTADVRTLWVDGELLC